MADPHTSNMTVATTSLPLDHTFLTDMSPDICTWEVGDPVQISASQLSKLIEILHTKVPREIFDQIQDLTLELAICPGYVYFEELSINSLTTKCNGKTIVAARPDLLRLSKSIYRKYQSRFHNDSTFLLGEGPRYSKGPLDALLVDPFLWIRKIHLVLTIDDERIDSFWTPDVRLTDRFGKERWVFKLKKICSLPITELTLDFTSDYKSLRKIGTGTVRLCRPPLHGVQLDLRIINGDEEREKKILEEIHDVQNPASPLVSHYFDCRIKGRILGTAKSEDPTKKKRKRQARERDLCDVKIKIIKYFPGARRILDRVMGCVGPQPRPHTEDACWQVYSSGSLISTHALPIETSSIPMTDKNCRG
ncbi:MAG: hypothetical protein Q9168_003222 [Polycauliona sp. 1 TL-2023]